MTAISESVKQRDLKQTMQVLIPLEPLTLTYIKVSKTVYEFTRIRTGTLLYPGNICISITIHTYLIHTYFILITKEITEKRKYMISLFE